MSSSTPADPSSSNPAADEPGPWDDNHVWPVPPPAPLSTKPTATAQTDIERIRLWHTLLRAKWNPAHTGYIQDVGILLKALTAAENNTTAITLPVIKQPVDESYERGWMACAAWIESKAHDELTRGRIARWDIYRMRQALAEIVGQARQARRQG